MITSDLDVRCFQPGDRFNPLGMKGTKKVKDFFIDNKIQPSKRKITPIVVHKGDVIWITGLRPSEKYRLKSGLKKVSKAIPLFLMSIYPLSLKILV